MIFAEVVHILLCLLDKFSFANINKSSNEIVGSTFLVCKTYLKSMDPMNGQIEFTNVSWCLEF